MVLLASLLIAQSGCISTASTLTANGTMGALLVAKTGRVTSKTRNSFPLERKLQRRETTAEGMSVQQRAKGGAMKMRQKKRNLLHKTRRPRRGLEARASSAQQNAKTVWMRKTMMARANRLNRLKILSERVGVQDDDCISYKLRWHAKFYSAMDALWLLLMTDIIYILWLKVRDAR